MTTTTTVILVILGLTFGCIIGLALVRFLNKKWPASWKAPNEPLNPLTAVIAFYLGGLSLAVVVCLLAGLL